MAVTERLGVVGDQRLRADLSAAHHLGGPLAWALVEFFEQDGGPVAGCARAGSAVLRALLHELRAALDAAGLAVEQLHAEYADHQFELTLPPAPPLEAAARSRAIVGESLEVAPFAKILYSSDAWGPSELHYLGALLWRRAVAEVMGGFVAEGHWSGPDAARVADMIAFGNARRIYQLAD